MNVDLKKYSNLKICVAVSGGRDSMALLHYLHSHAAEYGITLTALNCDHRIRGENSARDSAFVAEYCQKYGIPLSSYVADKKIAGEADARRWRLNCYLKEAQNCDCIATAHHLNDNAETVLFNLARGSALSGMEGITDGDITALANKPFKLIRPLIACTRAEIEQYIAANSIPYVDDETNFSTDYTRNKIRHNVLPALEEAVPGAAGAIFRFSRLAAEDEEYFERQVAPLIYCKKPYGDYIAHCEEKVIFRRAALKIIADRYQKKDYTSEHLERLYMLQFAENGKRFEFLNLTAFKEEGRICIAASCTAEQTELSYSSARGRVCIDGQSVAICCESRLEETSKILQENFEKNTETSVNGSGLQQQNFALKTLSFDGGKIPPSAVIRFARTGDRFTKFGGGTKKLGDYFTDKKIPVRLRKIIPLLCDGNEVLVVFGVEISEKVKTDGKTKEIMCAAAVDYTQL